MRNVLVLLILTIALLSDAKIPLTYFNPEHYQNASKSMNSKEKLHYDEYLKKFKQLGLKSNHFYADSTKYPDVIAQQFYHLRINLDKINEFKKLGVDLYKINDDLRKATFRRSDRASIYTTVEKPIIIIGKLESFHTRDQKEGELLSSILFQVEDIIKGNCYFLENPKIIKCYLSTDLNYSEEIIPVYGGFKRGLEGIGTAELLYNTKVILILDKNDIQPNSRTGKVSSRISSVKEDIYDENVFYLSASEAYLHSFFTEKDYEIIHKYSGGDYSLEQYLNLIEKVEKLNEDEVYNKSRGENNE
jgi:hypothetical protein